MLREKMPNIKYRYPESIDEFNRGTIYQVKNVVTEEWSLNKTISKLCCSTKETIELQIARKGIRIVENDNSNR